MSIRLNSILLLANSKLIIILAGVTLTLLEIDRLYCIRKVLMTKNNVFMPPKELWEAYSNRTVRPSVSPSVRPSVRPSRFRVRSISPIFFEVGISNLVCGYILGWRSVAYHFQVTATLTLTSDLVFRIIVSGTYL